jgi:hypothetical protein
MTCISFLVSKKRALIAMDRQASNRDGTDSGERLVKSKYFPKARMVVCAVGELDIFTEWCSAMDQLLAALTPNDRFDSSTLEALLSQPFMRAIFSGISERFDNLNESQLLHFLPDASNRMCVLNLIWTKDDLTGEVTVNFGKCDRSHSYPDSTHSLKGEGDLHISMGKYHESDPSGFSADYDFTELTASSYHSRTIADNGT